ncbi:DUF1634 domain-containing protein [Paraburkholderia sp.]|uniref:DUF1634 domain-containing protein n=1 Tax=Paraburkholderia sp. TaxID=1926495 RepID=UPI003D6F0DB4
MHMSKLERWLASLLEYGTWTGSVVMAVGVVLSASVGAGLHGVLATRFASVAMTAGVCIVILLPVARLILMLAMYCAGREYRFAGIAALVLLIVIIGCVAGVKLGPLAG